MLSSCTLLVLFNLVFCLPVRAKKRTGGREAASEANGSTPLADPTAQTRHSIHRDSRQVNLSRVASDCSLTFSKPLRYSAPRFLLMLVVSKLAALTRAAKRFVQAPINVKFQSSHGKTKRFQCCTPTRQASWRSHPRQELVGDTKEAEIADRLPEYKVSVIDDQANAVRTSDKHGASSARGLATGRKRFAINRIQINMPKTRRR